MKKLGAARISLKVLVVFILTAIVLSGCGGHYSVIKEVDGTTKKMYSAPAGDVFYSGKITKPEAIAVDVKGSFAMKQDDYWQKASESEKSQLLEMMNNENRDLNKTEIDGIAEAYISADDDLAENGWGFEVYTDRENNTYSVKKTSEPTDGVDGGGGGGSWGGGGGGSWGK